MEKILQAWSIKTLQETVNVYNHVVKEKKTMGDVERYVKEYGENLKRFQEEYRNKQQLIKERVSKCPDCGTPMILSESEIEENFCHWTCPKCRKGIPVNSSVDDELKRINLYHIVKRGKKDG